MTTNRRLGIDGWKARAVVAAISVGQALLVSRPRGGPLDPTLPAPLLQARAERAQEDHDFPWRLRVARERAWLQAGVAVWVAWRSYSLERRAAPPVSGG